MRYDLTFWAEAAQARVLSVAETAAMSCVSTDSRTVQEGDLFVALKGEKFDAHDHLSQVWERGAAAVVVSRVPDTWPTGRGILLVDDTLVALQRMARTVRRVHGWKVIGVTGSSGKTSTKDMLRAVLSKEFLVAATPGNLNNHIGVPLTLLRADPSVAVVICEMGTNHHGEIQTLVDIAEPDLAVITNIGTAHVEHLGSREGIAQEKGVLAESIPSAGDVILCADDDFCEAIALRCRGKVWRAGLAGGEVRGEILEAGQGVTRFRLIAMGQSVDVLLPVAGQHMVRNALLAASVGLAMGISLETVAAGLGELELTAGRLTRREIHGVIFLDDSYNANPQSMAAALHTLNEVPTEGRRVAVLGKMGELGAQERSEHIALGRLAASLDLGAVVAVGPGAEWIVDSISSGVAHYFADQKLAADWLQTFLRPGDLVLVKGSRSSKMEQVLQYFSSLR